VHFFGITVNGSTRWLNIGIGRIQPSEIMKIALPMMVAWYFQKYEMSLRWYHYVAAILLVLVPVCLDFETTRPRHCHPDYGFGYLRNLFRWPALESDFHRHDRLSVRPAAAVELRHARLSENPCAYPARPHAKIH
jgi:hypothetical protein